MKVGGSSYRGTTAILLGAMIVASVLTVMVPVAASGGWWDPGWQYREQMQIAEEPYYQVPLEIDAISLIDQGNLRPDLGDLRFVTTDDRELPYWIDPKTIPFTFQEDFGGDLSKWTLQTGGGFSVEGGELRSSGNQNILLANIPQLVNYTVETKIKLVGDSACGLVIGFQTGIRMRDGTHNTYYLVRLDGSSIKIYQYAKGWRLKWSKTTAISTNTWHDLKVEHLGSIIKVSLDGSEVGSWTQPWPTGWNWYSTSLIMNAESVGLMNYSGEAYWDDVTITTRPAKSRATVLMPSPVTEPTTIYMYYGNPSATSQSNIQSTFLFGDDFDDQVFDTNEWGVWSYAPGEEWTDEIRWVSEAKERQEMTSPIAGGERTYVHTLDTFTGPAAFKTRFEKGGYMYRGFDLVDSPIGADRTVKVNISFSDSGYVVAVGVWTKDEGWVENKTLFGSFISRNYFGEYYLTIVRNGDGTFTFKIETEDEHTKTWEYTTTATIPLDVPLQVMMYDHPWSGCRSWGVWERYQDDVRVLSSFTPNVPPTADAGGPYAANEGETITLDASGSTDPDDNIALYEWDLDDDGEYDDATGTTAAVTFGDNGSFSVGLRVTDEFGESDTDTAEVVVNNVAPTLTLDTSDAIPFAGGDAFLGRKEIKQTHQASATDPGSDDLTFRWRFGVVSTYYNDGVGPDPSPSPGGVFPFAATDDASVTFTATGVFYDVAVEVADDDGGTDLESLPKLVTGDGDCTKSQGFWKHQFSKKGKHQIDDVTLQAYLDIVGFASAVFSEQVPASTIGEARDVMWASGPSMRDKAEAQLLAAWLNFAHGSVGWDELIDTNDDDVGDTSFHQVMSEAEAILLHADATHEELEHAKDLAEAVNLHDEDNPACGD